MTNPTSTTATRRLREGKIALTFRIIVGIYAFFWVLLSPAPDLSYSFLAAIFNLVIYQLIATVLIWIPKLIQRAATKHE